MGAEATPKETGERMNASISVCLLLTKGRGGGLLLVRHGIKTGEEPSWGPVAGGMESEDATPWDAVLREVQQEAGIAPGNIIFVKDRDTFEPHGIVVQRKAKLSAGFVYRATYSGPSLPEEGWPIADDPKVDWARFAPWQEVVRLLEGHDHLYQPELNFAQLMRWLLETSDDYSRAERVHQWFRARQDQIPGLYRKPPTHSQLLRDNWGYTPPYESWTQMPLIHGDPRKTNFARARSRHRRTGR